MKHEKQMVFLTAAMLAFFTAWGAAGCLATAFDLTLESSSALILVCGLAAVTAAALLCFRWGGGLLLCLLALAAGYIHQDGTAGEQLLQLVYRLTAVYDRAYGLGVLQLTELAWDAGFADWPLGILGSMIALCVSWCIVRRTSVWLPVLATLLPLSSCIVVTDTVPEERWLLMVIASLILLVLTSEVRRENAAQGIRLTGAAAVPVVMALAVLFLISPQESYVNRSEILRENILITMENIPKLMDTGMQQVVSGLQSRPARQVDLAALGARIPLTYPVMEVTAQESGTLYLREQDYDLYDGLGWTATEDRSEPFPGTTGPGETILITAFHRRDIRFLPYHPTFETILTEGFAANEASEKTYTLFHSGLPENWRETAYQDTVSSDEWAQYLALPDMTRQGAQAWLSGLYSGSASNTAKADIIAALVTDSARYDLDPGKMPVSEPDFALWFLREGEAGYCIHFATAATVLLRAAGVPARYVTGYLLEAEAGQPVTVTEENAHAWAEYYEPNLGVWLPLEATPAEETPPRTSPAQPVPSETTLPAEPEAQPTEAVTEATLPRESEAPVLPTGPVEEIPAPAEKTPLPILILLLPTGVLILAVQRSLRLTLRWKKQRRGDPNRQALLRWRKAVRLSRLLKESPTEELIVLAQKAKFSQHRLSQEELNLFDSFSRSCIRRLRDKPWYIRLIHRFIYAAY